MKNQLTELDNIPEKVFDLIVKEFGNNPNYKVVDGRKTLFHNGYREYFLFSNRVGRGDLEWTFIWIHNNLWQFSYINSRVQTRRLWENPLDLLNKLLKL